ncbi:MAG: 3-methyl-2-oxobutanoate dehydrogenase subunit VorB [Clostridiales bacterium]|nr:3-methyl-2-oxobutanoate dehydrogenase subunit VorB [Clostridiales bacterium]MBQ6271202.1 3-methyl-2-oxobutanoate dehydrogenase subunit VorB [Clostridiales bacterium]MBR4010014.1 3-methyl-2-oxobutanoate dehydrogenase subunit VorB [Clostridiales bacterium]MCR5058954.1 3-methyl-2-oxobutanoate dehydrogenase subunit VorB [Clostridiales bacterium]
MAKRVLMKGNEVIAEAAIRAGCRHYFGYPITPQTEVMHYMAREMVKHGGTFVQAESEVAAINMVYGAAATGERVLTSSSSPGISLKQEGISYIAGAELPAVVVNIMRGGPGLGGILPSQSDYFQATKGGGHGDYKNLVIAPASVQELYELTVKAFDLADKYRILVMILGDGTMGQMMEPVAFKEKEETLEVAKPWATTGMHGRAKHNTITSIYIDPDDLEAKNLELQAKYREIEEKEVMVETMNIEDAEVVITAYGTCSRICKNVIRQAAELGIKVGMVRPITLWPFPTKEIAKVADMPSVKGFLDVELSSGQMIEDVRLAVNGKKPVYFHGRMGGNLPTQKEILDEIVKIHKGEM